LHYVSLLPGRIAESIDRATKNLEPARVGWRVIDDHAHTFCRRWIRRPDRMLDDPFGRRTVRANIHPGYLNPDVIAPSGPVDPGLTVLSLQSHSGRPIAVLANYSMHYFGAEPVSADYFGRFAAVLARRIGAEGVDPPFVGIMSQVTSGVFEVSVQPRGRRSLQRSRFLGQGLFDERLDGSFHELEGKRHGTAGVDFLVVI
jgi:hypothetical protein